MTLAAETPSVRVVEPEELTPFLGTDDSPENDSLLTIMLAAATDRLESELGVAMIQREFTEVRDTCDWVRRSKLLRGPLVSITSVKVDGETLEDDKFSLVGGEVVFDPPVFCNTTVELKYVAGYGTQPADVPAALRLAVLRLAATQFEHRENVVVGTISGPLPPEVAEIAGQYRRMFL